MSAVLLVVLSACYASRSDACAAITIWPVWIWSAIGLWLTLIALNRGKRRDAAILLCLWAVFTLVFADEPWSLLRGVVGAPAPSGAHALRVVTLNCAGGDPIAAAEVQAYHPDIVLLQESPGRRDVQALALRLYGSGPHFVAGPDASLLCRGTVTEEDLSADARDFEVAARVRLPSGHAIRVVSLRLHPQPVRLDLWSAECWRVYASIRDKQGRQTAAISRFVGAGDERIPVVLGGDFNAPQRDGIFRPLRGRFHEAFAEAGVGWGNTITNETPLLRIDQVWLSARLRCVRAEARRTMHSDHRIVVCDIVVTPSPK